MKKALKYSSILLLFVCGCQIGRDIGVEYCKESKLNTEAIRSTGHCVLEAWPSRYPFFEPFKPELNQQTVEAMDILNELALVDPNERTDGQLGTAVIRCIQVKYDFVKAGLSKYIPGIVLP